MLNKIITFLREFKSKIRHLFFLRRYRSDTPESTLKFYHRMKFLYRSEFRRRKKYSDSLENNKYIETLNDKGFVTLDLKQISQKKEFTDIILKFKKNFDRIIEYSYETKSKKSYLNQFNFEFNKETKILVDPFVDLVSKYLGTLPILDSLQLWYSPNDTEELIGSRSLHRDPEDFKQLKIFIPIEEIQNESGPLHVIDKQESKMLYEDLIKKGSILKRNQKIDDKYLSEYKLTAHKILLKEHQCAMVDTCACYHYGSRKSLKPRKLLFLHFTTAFSAKTPIFRKYDTEKKFSLEKDKLVYGLQKKTINHFKKRQYLNI